MTGQLGLQPLTSFPEFLSFLSQRMSLVVYRLASLPVSLGYLRDMPISGETKEYHKTRALRDPMLERLFELAIEFGLTTDTDDTTTNSSPNESPQSTSSVSSKESSESTEASPASEDRRQERRRPAVNTTPTSSTTTTPTSKMSSAGKGNGTLMACALLCLLSHLNFLCFLLI